MWRQPVTTHLISNLKDHPCRCRGLRGGSYAAHYAIGTGTFDLLQLLFVEKGHHEQSHPKPGHALPSPAIPRMKKVALTLIAQQLKDDDLKELRETFIQLDKNRDGTLSLLKFKL